MRYTSMSIGELENELASVKREYEACQALNLSLDMSRGKPGREQLDLSQPLLTNIVMPEDCIIDGTDARNYGMLDGLPSCKKFFAELLSVTPPQVFVGGNASLNLMYDVIAKAYTHGLLHSDRPWSKENTIKFLCPVPGYDRHFGISQSFGMEMISIPMTDEGPDMDAVERAVTDPAVRGMWCVPKFSNPQGIVYSVDVMRRIANLRPKAPDFLLMWDNAYFMHEIDVEYTDFPDIIAMCADAGNPDMVFEFASTSKITFPGAGVSCMASSVDNIKYMTKLLTLQTISYDKVNQLRHLLFLKDKETVIKLMKKHSQVLKPRFQAVLSELDKEIAPLELATWYRPHGGYFISLDTMPGCAKRTLELCKQAGVTMTPAGATHPYGKDPDDKNIRIAPSFPPVSELTEAIRILCICLKLAALEKLLYT